MELWRGVTRWMYWTWAKPPLSSPRKKSWNRHCLHVMFHLDDLFIQTCKILLIRGIFIVWTYLIDHQLIKYKATAWVISYCLCEFLALCKVYFYLNLKSWSQFLLFMTREWFSAKSILNLNSLSQFTSNMCFLKLILLLLIPSYISGKFQKRYVVTFFFMYIWRATCL